MIRRMLLLSFCVLLLCLSACSESPQPAAEPAIPEAEPLPQPAADVPNETAPDKYRVKFETTAGDFTVEVHRDWAPRGADRFYNLVKSGFYDDVGFFRVVPGFVVQFGINGDPKTHAQWDVPFPDDPVKESNRRGTITFATSGPDSRTTQVFINFGDNSQLDSMDFSPFGEVVEGMENVDKINAQYGEEPDQGAIRFEGNAYLKREFPKLDYVKRASLVDTEPKPEQ